MAGSQAHLRPRQDQLLAYAGTAALLTGTDGAVSGPRDGYFHDDCRLLSRAIVRLDGKQPETFSAGLAGPGGILAYGRLSDDGDLLEDALFTTLRWLIAPDGLHCELRVRNYAPHRERRFELAFGLAADFADFQEAGKPTRTQCAPVECEWDAGDAEICFRYQHPELSVATRVSVLSARFAPQWDGDALIAQVVLGPQEEAAWEFRIAREAPIPSVREVLVRDARRAPVPPAPTLETTNATVSMAWETAIHDLQSLPLGLAGGGQALAAGAPLYLHFFGRDTLTAGWQGLLAGPEYLRDALRLNADLQGTRVDDAFDEQPGRMIHEARFGPLSLLGEDSLIHNYSDYATPPDFVAMLAEYYAWTGDRRFTRSMLPAAWRALDWLETYGDLDGDGFLEYVTRSPHGVKNQGWKDAPDSIVDDNGRIPENPLATSELQGYWYAALQLGALLAAEVAHDFGLARRYQKRAARLRKQFNEAFWLEGDDHYALALDAAKRPIRAAGSNDAHLFVTGILPRERATRVVRRLFQPDIFTGWGIRTLSSEHPAYNPFSYHRGSVWPVEHGTFALGLARYGFWDEAARVAKGMFDAAELFQGHRLPEVIGGLQRDDADGHPGIYPDSCAPQAWSASTITMLLQTLIGLHPLAPFGITVFDPHLPEWLPELHLRGIRVGQAELDLHAWRRKDGSSGFKVTKRGGRMLVLRQPPPQDPRGTLAARLRGLWPM